MVGLGAAVAGGRPRGKLINCRHFAAGAGDRKAAFLKARAASPATNETLLAYMDSYDPLEKARRALETSPEESSGPVRAALAATF